jgi:hypothetical protein
MTDPTPPTPLARGAGRMPRTITIALQVRGKGRREVQITPRWAGKGLAVHKPVIIDDNDQPVFRDWSINTWTLTHIHTGLSAGIFYGNLKRATAFARQWDEAFSAVITSNVPQQLIRDYSAALYGAAGGGLMS